jgi:hypothetical protein
MATVVETVGAAVTATKDATAATLDNHAVSDWRDAHKMWSIQIAVFWAVVAGVWMALPAFQDRLDPFWFAALCIVFSLAICFARLTHQPGLPD